MSHGYAALSSVIILGAIFVTLGSALVLSSINQGQSTLVSFQNHKSLDSVESCVNEALLRLNQNASLPTNIILPTGNCIITQNSQVGTTWNFTVTQNTSEFQKSIHLIINRTNKISIVTWQEL